MRVTSGDDVNEGVDEYILYPIDVSLGFSHTATELNGWCPPKSAVCGFHPDNDIGTLDLLAKWRRVNYKVRLGTRKRLRKVSGSAQS
jgi:hypothetical protein